MRIIVDAFRGDSAPLEILKGCGATVRSLDIDIILTGREDEIQQTVEGNQISLGRMEIFDAPQALTMEDHADATMEEKKDSSMAEGLRLVAKGKGDTFVSAGSSGTLVVGATMVIERIKGIRRVTFTPMVSDSKGFFMFIDSGVNVDCRPGILLQFGVMGSIYLDKVIGVRDLRVTLANVGIEDHKSDELQHQAFVMLRESKLNFIDNIEARDILNDDADVVVADGFTGNITLKMSEGVVSMVMDKFKEVFIKNPKNKMAAALLLGGITMLKKSMDYNEYGDAPVIGASKPVFKVHDSAETRMVGSALRLIKAYVEKNVTEEIKRAIFDQEQYGISKQDEGRNVRTQRLSFKDLKKKLQYHFQNPQYLITAMTHSSYASEVKSGGHSNERLEFLGDSVLSIVVADYLFKHCPNLPKDELTRNHAALVCEKALCGFSRRLGLGEHLLLSRGKQNSGGRQRSPILADAFETLIAAIYLDAGLEKAREFISRFVLPVLRTSRPKAFEDYKAPLQEIIQQNPEEQLEYMLIGKSDPDHDRHPTVEMCFSSNVIGRGGRRSKGEAEQQAAREMLGLMGY